MNDEAPDNSAQQIEQAAARLGDVADKLAAVVDRMERSMPRQFTAPDGTQAGPQVMQAVQQAEDSRHLQSIESLVQRILDSMEGG